MRTTLLGLAVNASLAGAKLVAGFFGHSQALIADGIESLADVGSSVIVWRGIVVAAEPADADHPYGHGKAEPLAAIAVAAMLIAAAFWIAVQAINEIAVPHHLPARWTLAVLIVVIVCKEALFRHVLERTATLDSTVVQSDAWHHRSDAITSLAALVGIVIAIVGGPGYEAADDYAALLAAGIIAWNGLRMMRAPLDELMDRSPNAEFTEEVRAKAKSIAEVVDVEKCAIRKMGGHYFVDMHVEVDPQMTVVAAHAVAHDVKDAIRGSFPQVQDVLVHIEPAGGGVTKIESRGSRGRR